MTAERQPRFALYTRISKDPTGASTAPARQEKECRALARERGIKIVDVYTDVDLSAYSGVKRPGYEALLDEMAKGTYDGVLVWKLDRLIRRVVEFSRFWQVATEHKVALISKSDTIDTTNPIGLGIVYLIVALAEQESFNTSMRLKARERESAESGQHKSRGRKVYGLTADWTTVDQAEADVIREVADRIIDGESVSAIANDLNARAVPSPRRSELQALIAAARADVDAAPPGNGAEDEARARLAKFEAQFAAAEAKPRGLSWTRAGLASLMRSPRLYGRREWESDGETKVVDGDWPLILDEATGTRVRQLLSARRGSGADSARRYLLSGILRCEKCGARMKAQHSATTKGRYVCPPKVEGGCGGTTILLDETDAAITEKVMAALDGPELAEMLKARKSKLGNDAELLIELNAIGKRTDELASMWAAGELSRKAWSSASRKLEQRGDELAHALALSRQAAPLATIGEKGIVKAWASFSLERKRAVVEAVIDRIIVHGNGSEWYREHLAEKLLEEADEYRAAGDERSARRRERQAAERTGGGGSFRPERLEVIWRV